MGTFPPSSSDAAEEVDAPAGGTAVGRWTDDVTRARYALSLLTQANESLLGELSLEKVLHSITVAARDLVGARYAALGVIGRDGGLAEFVHVGMDDATVQRIGPLPRGRGLLGALVEDPRTLRLRHLADDGRRAGFPEHHPKMDRLLGTPIVVRGSVYGNLYLTDRVDGRPFSVDDEQVIEAFSTSAGIAIENARHHDAALRSQRWADATAEVTDALVHASRRADPVALVVDALRRLADADFAAVAVPTADPAWIRLTHVRGDAEEALEGTDYPFEGSAAGEVMRTGRAVLVEAPDDQEALRARLRNTVDLSVLMVLPLQGARRLHGVLSAGRRPGRAVFSPDEVALAESFAAQAAVAMELAEAQADQERLLVVGGRERIARDLHDHVVRRLFDAADTLDATARRVPAPDAVRLDRVVDDLDVTIADIRTLIFGIDPAEPGRTVRSVVLAVVAEAAEVLGFEPAVVLEGPVEAVVDDSLVSDVSAVVREALSNTARHARATSAEVRVRAEPQRLVVVVSDDGVGLGGKTRHSGVGNLEQRAAARGGASALVASPSGGTEARWSVPLP